MESEGRSATRTASASKVRSARLVTERLGNMEILRTSAFQNETVLYGGIRSGGDGGPPTMQLGILSQWGRRSNTNPCRGRVYCAVIRNTRRVPLSSRTLS